MDTFTATMIAEGLEEASEERTIEAWQLLHDTGLAYQLQGWYGRQAKALIEAGIINAQSCKGKQGMQHYWKQTDYNKYVLATCDAIIRVFNTYEDLYAYCQRNNINATQV